MTLITPYCFGCSIPSKLQLFINGVAFSDGSIDGNCTACLASLGLDTWDGKLYANGACTYYPDPPVYSIGSKHANYFNSISIYRSEDQPGKEHGHCAENNGIWIFHVKCSGNSGYGPADCGRFISERTMVQAYNSGKSPVGEYRFFVGCAPSIKLYEFRGF